MSDSQNNAAGNGTPSSSTAAPPQYNMKLIEQVEDVLANMMGIQPEDVRARFGDILGPRSKKRKTVGGTPEDGAYEALFAVADPALMRSKEDEALMIERIVAKVMERLAAAGVPIPANIPVTNNGKEQEKEGESQEIAMKEEED